MANATHSSSNELVYNFPIDAPMSVLHINGYTVGANLNFAGDKGFLIAACGMCTFAVAKSETNPSAMVYAQDLLMIMLRFGLTHTIFLTRTRNSTTHFDRCASSYTSMSTLSAANHDPILVERTHTYLNKGLKIPNKEEEIPAISWESVLLL